MITSSANPTIKRIRNLRQRKERDASASFFIEGIRLVGEAVQLGAAIETLVVAPDLLSSGFARELVTEQAAHGVNICTVSAEVFASLSQKDGPQGVGAVIRQRWHDLASVRELGGLGWIALDAVADPGNLGTIIRTADAVGASGVILLGDTTDPYDPAALRASMGAIFAQRLVRTELNDFLGFARRHGLFLLGTSDAAAASYHHAAYPLPLILLMGSERQGLHPEAQAACDLMVSIPMRGRSDSLNLAVATGVMLYELVRRQG